MSVIDTDREAALRDLPDGSRVDRVLLVRDVQRCTTRTGSEYLRLVVGDRSAQLPAVMWEPSAEADRGPVLRVVGRVTEHSRYGRQVIVSELQAIDPDEADLRLLLPGPQEPLADLACRLDSTLESVEDTWLRHLLGSLIGPAGELRERFVRATAAKYNHHAYPGDCSSTPSRSPTPRPPLARSTEASIETSRWLERCYTTSASSTPTTMTRSPAT